MTTPVGFGYRLLVEGLLAEAGVSPRISFESGNLATIEGLVASGLGVAISGLSTPVIARVWVNADARDSRQPWISRRVPRRCDPSTTAARFEKQATRRAMSPSPAAAVVADDARDLAHESARG